jgi:hypothetical protein
MIDETLSILARHVYHWLQDLTSQQALYHWQ